MKNSIPLALAVAALTAAAVPTAARAETASIRVGVEAPVYTHNSVSGFSNSYSIGDTLQPAIDVLLGYKPLPLIAFNLEVREGFAATSGDKGYQRTGTAIGPGLTISPPLIPIYVRASIPIHVEPSPVFVGLRAAAGLEFTLLVVGIYVEAAADFSLAGGSYPNTTTNVGAFDTTQISLGAGASLKF